MQISAGEYTATISSLKITWKLQDSVFEILKASKPVC